MPCSSLQEGSRLNLWQFLETAFTSQGGELPHAINRSNHQSFVESIGQLIDWSLIIWLQEIKWRNSGGGGGTLCFWSSDGRQRRPCRQRRPGRQRRPYRQRRKKKKHLIEAAPFGRFDQMLRTTVYILLWLWVPLDLQTGRGEVAQRPKTWPELNWPDLTWISRIFDLILMAFWLQKCNIFTLRWQRRCSSFQIFNFWTQISMVFGSIFGLEAKTSILLK